MGALRWWGLYALVLCVGSVHTSTQLHVSPIRRVLNMLQMMQKKVTEEGKAEQELFDKYMCYCKSSGNTLDVAIAGSETKIPQLESSIEAGTAEKASLTADVTHAQKDKDAAEESIKEAKALRAREADAFAKEDASNKANVAAMVKALKSLREGVGAAFLQTADGGILRHLAVSTDLPEWDRQTLTAFLATNDKADDQENSDADSESYSPDSGEIIGIIDQMKDTIEADILEAAAVEKKAIEDFDSLVGAKSKEVAALTKEIEGKTARLGEVGVELVNLAQDLADTSKMLAQDRKFKADLDSGCKQKQDEWSERTATRNMELVTLADTTSMLNNDEVTHLMKKTMAHDQVSFLQLQETTADVVHDARAALKLAKGPRDPRLNLVSMAMRGKKVNFDKVVGLVDKMMGLLGKEQTDDDEKRTYCVKEIASADDNRAALKESISDNQKNIENSKAMAASIKEDIAKLSAGIKALNAAVAESTELRKTQNAAYVEELAANNAAIEILTIAKDRLNQFYNPNAKLIQKASGTHHRHEAAAAPTIAPAKGVEELQEAFSFLQESESQGSDAKPPPAPKDNWKEKGAKGESGGVLGLLNMLIKDAKLAVSEIQKEEKDTQFEYEQFMKDSSEKRMEDAKAISGKEGAKAEIEAGIQKRGKELKEDGGKLVGNAEYLASLHTQCDWLQKNYKVRRDARTSEIAALRQSKGVLRGADYPASFLQVHTEKKRNLRRR